MPAILDLSFVQSMVEEPITKFELKSVTIAGDNIAGEIKGIRAYTPNGTVDLIHKTLTGSELKGPAVEFQFFRKETAFYRVAVPKLEFVVNQRLQRCYPNPLLYKFPAPKVYAAFNDDEDDYLVVEDVRPGGYVMPDKYAGFNFNEVTLVLSELAKFHAYTYFLIKWEGEKLFDSDTGELRILGNNFWLDPKNRQDSLAIARQSYYSAVSTVSEEAHRKKLQGFFDNDDELFDRFKLPYTWTESELFPVIVLGDCWVNNIMIKYEKLEGGGKRPLGLKFIDFQLTRRGNLFEDLHYFLYTSTTPAFRRMYLNEVLENYFTDFAQTLQVLQFPMPANFTKERFMSMFEKGRLSAFMFMCFAIPIQLGNHKAAEEACRADEGPAKGRSDGGSKSSDPVDDMVAKGVIRLRKSPQALRRFNDIAYELFEYGILK